MKLGILYIIILRSVFIKSINVLVELDIITNLTLKVFNDLKIFLLKSILISLNFLFLYSL